MRRVLLAFPLTVVTLASAAFFFGGRCAAWQWWVAAAFTVVAGFWRCPMREGVRNGVLFLGWLFVVWVGCGLAVAPNWFDESVYHVPAVRMLADGWNPLVDRTPESALRFAGLSAGDCRIDHIVFLPKIVWVFNAVAYHFTGDLFNPMVPVLWFLFPAVVLHVWRAMEGAHVAWKILSVPLLICLQFNSAYVVDSVVVLAAIGLLLAFAEVLSGRKVDVLSLVVYSFWMMGAKTTGLLHGGLFWAVFLAFAIRSKAVARRLSVAVAATGILLAVACASPFLSSLVDYGHPLYPQYTFDEKRFPPREMAWEFAACQNGDAAQMGYCGRYVNAFVSPSLARVWYRSRLGKHDFRPESSVWRHYPTDGDGSSPTRLGMRIAFWFSTGLLLFVASKQFRPIALMVLLGIAAVPPQMLGYIRYIPWWLSPVLFLFVDSARRCGRWWQALALLLVVGSVQLRPQTLAERIVYAVRLVDERRSLMALLDGVAELPPIRPYVPMATGQLKLMRRHLETLGRAKLLPCSQSATARYLGNVELPGKLFFFDDARKMRQYAYDVPSGAWRRVGYVLRVCAKTLPLAIGKRVGSVFERQLKRDMERVQ